MKFSTAMIHRLVLRFRLESFFLYLGRRCRFAKKFLPQPSAYPGNDSHLIERDGVRYLVNRSDYMQWVLFADLEDSSWTSALRYLVPGGVMFDIGANCGQFCLKVAAAYAESGEAHRVFAFEPNPTVLSRLRENLSLNPKLSSRVRLMECALSDQQGTFLFAFARENSGGGTLRSREEETSQSFPVAVERLDDVVSLLCLERLDFLKIDVEGFEPEVLRGGESTIRRFSPVIYFECTPGWYSSRGESMDKMLLQLQGWGYQLQAEVNGTWHSLSAEALASSWSTVPQFNVLALPASTRR